MQVIFVATGEVKQVPDGYARNYLFPRKLATAATAEGITQAEAKQAELAQRQAAQQKQNTELVKKMSTIMVRCAAKASATGRLFSSVHVNDVLPLLEAQGVMVTADQISLPVIKQVGDHVGAFTLPGQPAVHFTVTVTTA